MKRTKLTKDELKKLEAELPHLHGKEYDSAVGNLLVDFWDFFVEIKEER